MICLYEERDFNRRRRKMKMIYFTGIHCPFDIPFVARREGRDVLLVSRSQLCLPRKLIFFRAKQLDYALHGLLRDDQGSIPVGVIENFPRLPDTDGFDAKRLRAKLRVSVPGPSGSLPPHIIYLLELGFDHEQINAITHKYPAFAYCNLERKIRPLIEFLLDLGVPKSNLPSILIRCPRLCGISLSENLIPSMTFLETFGVDKSKWVQLLSSYPGALTYSRKKIEAVVEFLREVGLSEQSIGKVLTRFPQIIGHSVEDKLRPLAEYYQSIGADVAAVLGRWPKILSLSIETNVKPTTEFFLENGFSVEEIGAMISRFGALYTYSLKGNLVAKWELFLTMDYPREDLVKFPQYFSYSLEERIKPRYNLMKESGVKLSLGQLLSSTDTYFELLLEKKLEKLQLESYY